MVRGLKKVFLMRYNRDLYQVIMAFDCYYLGSTKFLMPKKRQLVVNRVFCDDLELTLREG